MRTIKFRAWDKVKKEIFDPVGVMDLNQKGVMQYTGLKDKNGKEIYEGDIVKLERTLSNNAPTYFTNEIVEWRGLQLYPFCLDHKTSFEVIGNIYENPELLK